MELHLRVPVALGEYLRIHAVYLRDVSISRLVRDILTLWVISMTDTKDPVFDPRRVGVALPAFTGQPKAGYLESLCDDGAD